MTFWVEFWFEESCWFSLVARFNPNGTPRTSLSRSSAKMRSAFADMIGTKLAHYEITGHLGTGGMGEVLSLTEDQFHKRGCGVTRE